MAAPTKSMHLELASKDDFKVIQFRVEESISELFSVELAIESPKPDIDLDNIVGHKASFRCDSGKVHLGDRIRQWTGICSDAQLLDINTYGPAKNKRCTYGLRIVPRLWLLSQRSNYRIFQHESVPTIVDTLLGQWEIDRTWGFDRKGYPKLEYRVQYGETDYAFISRMLEEAGIAFFVPDDAKGKCVVTLTDKAHAAKPRGRNIKFVEEPNEASESEFVTQVELGHDVCSGRQVVRDVDFRNPDFALLGEADGDTVVERRYERMRYHPGGFRAEVDKKNEATPSADVDGADRHSPTDGKRYAERLLAAERVDQREIAFDSNTTDLWPGVVLAIEDHPHPAFARPVLITALNIQGTENDAWTTEGKAVFNDVPYQRGERTPKPRATGVQTATVVGPKGEEIYTDEYGRVRVKFPWDRTERTDAKSSCWIRVAQGWAGTGYGMVHIPRIGHEVLVSFLEGDPDEPIVTGRVFNATQPPPYTLPDHKTRSTWRSNSTPGGEGFNEIMFEDLKGSELVWLQAEKDQRTLVKRDVKETVGRDRALVVRRNDFEHTDNNRTEVTGDNRVELNDKNLADAVKGARSARVKGDAKMRLEAQYKRYVGKDRHAVVKGDHRERIDSDHHVRVKGSVSDKTGMKRSLSVAKDLHEKVGGSHALQASQELHISAGQSLVVEAEMDLTIKGPGGFVRLTPAGVIIKGTLVNLNAGSASAASGTPAQPDAPKPPIEAKIEPPKPPKEPPPKPKTSAKTKVDAKSSNDATSSGDTKSSGGKKKQDEVNKDLNWIEVQLVGEDDTPVSGVHWELIDSQGQRHLSSTNEKGVGRIENLPSGSCKFSFHMLDKRVWDKTSPPSKSNHWPMNIVPSSSWAEKLHKVAQGESIESIAARSGHLAKVIWEHTKNAKLRKKRKSGHVLYPGDEVYIPKVEKKTEMLATQKRHPFLYKTVPAKFEVQFLVDDKPRKGEKYTIEIDGEKREGKLDGDGKLKQPLSPLAQVALVKLYPETDDQEDDPQEIVHKELSEVAKLLGEDPPKKGVKVPVVDVHRFDLRALDPAKEGVSGAQQRLHHFGYDIGDIDGEIGERTRDAIAAFQEANQLEPSGELDEATRNKLNDVTTD